MLPRISSRQFHDQTNTAAAALAVLAEFGISRPEDTGRSRELELHGLLQRGRYEESRGLLLRNAVSYLVDSGLYSTIFFDAERAAALQERLSASDPEARLQFPDELRCRGGRPLSLEKDFGDHARVLLVEARHAARGIPIHILLARREDETYFVMNTATGQDYIYQPAHIAAHLGSPVRAGAVAFAGRQYLYTGIAVRITMIGTPCTSRGQSKP